MGGLSMQAIADTVERFVPPQQKSCVGYQARGTPLRESVVEMRFTVTATGRVKDVEVVDGFYDERAAKSAVDYLAGCRYEPATRHGVPAEVEGLLFTVVYRLPLSPSDITPSFRQELMKAVELVQARQPHDAQVQVQHMLADEVKWLYEVDVLNLMLSETSQKIGDPIEALYYSRRVTRELDSSRPPFVAWGETPPPNNIRRYVLPENLLMTAFRRRFLLDAQLGYVNDALKAYWDMAGFRSFPADDPLRAVATQLAGRLADSAPLVAQAKIREDGVWQHVPIRRTFSVTDVAGGELKQVLVSCGRNYRRFVPFQPGVDWTLPSKGWPCFLRFDGTAGTTFRIVEANLPTPDPEPAS
jgi:hypothetical protein